MAAAAGTETHEHASTTSTHTNNEGEAVLRVRSQKGCKQSKHMADVYRYCFSALEIYRHTARLPERIMSSLFSSMFMVMNLFLKQISRRDD